MTIRTFTEDLELAEDPLLAAVARLKSDRAAIELLCRQSGRDDWDPWGDASQASETVRAFYARAHALAHVQTAPAGRDDWDPWGEAEAAAASPQRANWQVWSDDGGGGLDRQAAEAAPADDPSRHRFDPWEQW